MANRVASFFILALVPFVKCVAVPHEGASTDNLITWPLFHDTHKAKRQCLAMTNDAFIRFAKLAKVENYVVIFNGKACNRWHSCVTKYDARKAPMERGWVVLYLYTVCMTLEQWALENGLPFLIGTVLRFFFPYCTWLVQFYQGNMRLMACVVVHSSPNS